MQIRQQLRNRHVHASQVSGVQTEEVLERGHEARVCGARGPVRSQTEREEGAEGEGQTEQYHQWIAGHHQNGTRGNESDVEYLSNVAINW